MSADLMDWLGRNEPRMRETWEYLHSIPEAGFEEHKTSAFLAARLRDAGYAVSAGVGGTGVVGVMEAGPGPAVGLRADMDALRHDIGGRVEVRHSCGHDAHSTMVLSVAEAVAACGGIKAGRLVILFQPAEEILGGARAIIKAGVLKGLDYLFGVHLRPVEELALGTATPSIRHGASGIMLASVTGKPAHGARPHLGTNAAEAAALAILSVGQVKVDPRTPHSAKVTMIRGGGASLNSIPDRVDMAFDLRAQTNQVMADLRSRVSRAIETAAAANGAVGEAVWKDGVPAAQDHPAAVDIARRAIARVLGEGAVRDPLVTPGGEDFHVYSTAIEGLKTTMVGLGADLVPGLHHPEMTFDRSVLVAGAKILATIALEAMA